MADDFKVGDVVVCVDMRTPNKAGKVPSQDPVREGSYYRVRRIYCKGTGPGICLEGIADNEYGYGYHAFRFRKLPPASKEFTARIRACKPHNAKVTA